MSVSKQIKNLAYESLIYGISGTVAKSIGIFLIPVYTKIFSPSDFGTIALISSLTDLMGMFVVLGLDNSSARWFYDSDKKSDQKCTISSWFWCQFCVSLIFAIGLSSVAYQVSVLLLKSSDYGILIQIAALTIPFGTFIKVFGNLLRYQRRGWTTSIFLTANSIGTIGAIIILIVVYKWGLFGIFSARLLAATTIALVALFMLKDWISTVYFSWKRLKEMLAFGLPLVPAAIASWITFSSDRYILQMFHNTSEVGLYSIAASLASGVALFTGAFQLAWGPFAFSIYREKESLDVYSRVFSFYALIFCFLGTVVSLFSPLLLRILTTTEYYSAYSCVPYLAFSYIALGATYLVSLGSGIAKKSRPIAISIFIGALVNIAFNFLLIPILGKEGAAISTLTANLCGATYLYIASQKNFQIPYKPKHAIVCLGFSFVLIAIDYFFIPIFGVRSFFLRIGMCFMFIPLAFWLGVIELVNVTNLFYSVSRRITIFSS
jgi:O-antigen/teichoic acid export membrane protein